MALLGPLPPSPHSSTRGALACPVAAVRLSMARMLERVRYAMDSGDKGIRLLGGLGPPLSHASTSEAGRCKRRSTAAIPYLSLW
jgi:hypothetical protein